MIDGLSELMMRPRLFLLARPGIKEPGTFAAFWDSAQTIMRYD